MKNYMLIIGFLFSGTSLFAQMEKVLGRYSEVTLTGSVTSYRADDPADPQLDSHKRRCLQKSCLEPDRVAGKVGALELQTLYDEQLKEMYGVFPDGEMRRVKIWNTVGELESLEKDHVVKVTQTIGSGLYLGYIRGEGPYAFNLYEEGIADDTYIRTPLRELDQTYSYTSVLGARKTVRMFAVFKQEYTRPTFEHIQKAWQNGAVFTVKAPCVFPCLCGDGTAPCRDCNGTGVNLKTARGAMKQFCGPCRGKKVIMCKYCKGKKILVLPGLCKIVDKKKK